MGILAFLAVFALTYILLTRHAKEVTGGTMQDRPQIDLYKEQTIPASLMNQAMVEQLVAEKEAVNQFDIAVQKDLLTKSYVSVPFTAKQVPAGASQDIRTLAENGDAFKVQQAMASAGQVSIGSSVIKGAFIQAATQGISLAQAVYNMTGVAMTPEARAQVQAYGIDPGTPAVLRVETTPPAPAPAAGSVVNGNTTSNTAGAPILTSQQAAAQGVSVYVTPSGGYSPALQDIMSSQ
jgi:hypothetical protein